MVLTKLKHIVGTLIITIFYVSTAYAQLQGSDGLGQVIKITTRFSSFVGKPIWLLEIRDLDNNQTIPYMFDITRGDNFWMLFTFSKNYLIVASTMQFSNYQSRYNTFSEYKINNFCHLESNGRIARGESLHVWIQGALTPNTGTYQCNITRYKDPNFSIAPL